MSEVRLSPTIMASAGAQCDHVNHVSTQLPYAISCAVISGICYLVAGLLAYNGAPGMLGLPLGIVLMIGFLLVMKKRHRLSTAHTITTVGMLAAISGVLMVIELPLFFAPPFYKLDFSELPVLICAFSLGPVAGVVCEFLKVLIHLLLKGTSTAFVGDLANFLVGCSFVLPASILYQKLLSKKGAVASLALGTGVMTVFGSFFNAWFLIPRFAVMYGLPLDAIIAMGTQVNGAITDLSTLVLLAVVPFNLLKGVLVSVLTFFLYKRVERLFFRKKQPE